MWPLAPRRSSPAALSWLEEIAAAIRILVTRARRRRGREPRRWLPHLPAARQRARAERVVPRPEGPVVCVVRAATRSGAAGDDPRGRLP
jgi:hypothetical protein